MRLNVLYHVRRAFLQLHCVLVFVVAITAYFGWERVSVAANADVSPNAEDEVRALAAAYLMNRDSFKQEDCTYELRQFRPDDEEQVFRNVVQPEGVAMGYLVRDGSKMCCKITVSDDVMDAIRKHALKGNRTVFLPRSLLLDGERGMSYSEAINGGGLFSSATPPHKGLVFTPFSFGRFTGKREEDHPGAIIENPDEKARVGLLTGEIPGEPHAVVGAHELVGIEYSKLIGTKRFTMQFFLAPTKGYLPIICRSYYDGKISQKVVITDVRQISKDRAYPIRTVNVQYGEGKSPIDWALETRVTSLKVDEPMDSSLFQVPVAKNAAIRDLTDINSQFKMPNDGLVGLKDIDGLFEQAARQSAQQKIWDEENAKTVAVKGNEPPDPPRHYRRRLWLILLCLTTVVALCLTFVIHRRKART